MSFSSPAPYQPKFPIRIVTAASLFDGHDAAINIMRRIMQSTGAEVIHLGHNRSVQEVVNCAIQEDAQGIAITSYQGGHVEYFKYMYDLLKEQGCGHIRLFGGGGGTILPAEIEELHSYGIARIYSPDDGMAMGLQGMINDVLLKCDFPTSRLPMPYLPQMAGMDEVENEQDLVEQALENLSQKDDRVLGRLISIAENEPDLANFIQDRISIKMPDRKVPVLGITGTGGAGKSSLIDELVRRFLLHYEDATLALISVDPSKRKTGGALLGDRIRMNAINHPRIYMRSLATRQSNLALSRYVKDAIDICKAADFDLVIVETSGIGQSDTEIIEHSDVSMYVMTSEYGAATQLEKIDMLGFA
ncbi:MAG TPA: cobalamin-dependent protein, partial [Catalimonadaceae bacterium]|nr:cobalamin-dependent protein [Catalimonadaceae bacterium]